MKTDKKTMAEIYRHMADNLDNNLFIYSGIEIFINAVGKWDIIDNDIYKMDFKNFCYRIKPQTIAVNGVEIPKPLDKNEIIESSIYYSVNHNCNLFGLAGGDRVLKEKIIFVYKDQEEAIEASKKLFGIE